MITERPPTSRDKKLKFHPDMFKDRDGIPQNSMILEKGLHINDIGLKALIEDPDGERLFNNSQYGYIKLHLDMCKDCLKSFHSLEKALGQQPAEEQRDLPL